MAIDSRDIDPPAQQSGVTIRQYNGWGRGGLPSWVAMPDQPDPDAPPLIAIHGLHRGAESQVEQFACSAARSGRTVIAPLFERRHWPRYQQVVRKGRADLALLQLLQDLEIAGVWTGGPFEIFGYSAGAQFAHRFAMLYPHLVTGVHLAAAGWYTFPDAAPFPFGIGSSSTEGEDWGPRLTNGLTAFLRLPVRVYVGSLDNVVDHNTRSGPDIDAQQGATRLDRARNWTAALSAAAARIGVTPNVSMTVLEGCAHEFAACVQIGGLDRRILDPARCTDRPYPALQGDLS